MPDAALLIECGQGDARCSSNGRRQGQKYIPSALVNQPDALSVERTAISMRRKEKSNVAVLVCLGEYVGYSFPAVGDDLHDHSTTRKTFLSTLKRNCQIWCRSGKKWSLFEFPSRQAEPLLLAAHFHDNRPRIGRVHRGGGRQ